MCNIHVIIHEFTSLRQKTPYHISSYWTGWPRWPGCWRVLCIRLCCAYTHAHWTCKISHYTVPCEKMCSQRRPEAQYDSATLLPAGRSTPANWSLVTRRQTLAKLSQFDITKISQTSLTREVTPYSLIRSILILRTGTTSHPKTTVKTALVAISNLSCSFYHNEWHS